MVSPWGQSDNGKFPSFIELSFDYFRYYDKQDLKFTDFLRTLASSVEIMHFTDLLRYFHLLLQTLERQREREDETVDHLPSTIELREAGVKFKANESKCLLY